MKLVEKDKKHIWHPFTPFVGSSDPIVIKSAKGVYLTTEDDVEILDAISSWWVNLHGHSHPVLADALAKQAHEMEHVIFAGFTHPPAIQLAENLISILPANQSKIFFSDDGSTSVEVALKMAIQYWHNRGKYRNKIIAFEGAYHGDTFGAMSVGDRGEFTAPFSPYLFDVASLHFPDERNEKKILKLFDAYLNGGDIAAFIFEPLIQGAGGMRTYSAVLLDKLIAKAKERGVICIADEVMTGFGRTGKMFASDYLDHKPDIFCLSKGITGGTMPLGVTTCTEAIVEAYIDEDIHKTFFHGHSYTANPLACAVANASFELLMSDETQAAISMINDHHTVFARSLEGNSSIVNIRVLGTILAIELNSGGKSGYTNDLRKKIYPFFLDRNILLRPLGNVLYILPPYVIKSEELKTIYRAIEEFLTEMSTDEI